MSSNKCFGCDQKLVLCILDTLKEQGYLNNSAPSDLSNYYNKSQVDAKDLALSTAFSQGLLGKVNVNEEYINPYFVKSLAYNKVTGAPKAIQFARNGSPLGGLGTVQSVNFVGNGVVVDYNGSAVTLTFEENVGGYKTGTQIYSSNGLQTTFSFPHNLPAAPTFVSVTPETDDASWIKKVTSDATNIVVHYDVAPKVGVNNVELNWVAIIDQLTEIQDPLGELDIEYLPSPTGGEITSNLPGTNGIIPLAGTTNAGLFSPSEKTKLGDITLTSPVNLDTLKANLQAIISLSGMAANSVNLGTFSGTSIPDNATIKQALQAIELLSESNQGGIQFKDEGTDIGTRGQVKNINFVGASATASISGDTLTIVLSGSSGGGAGATNLNYVSSPTNGIVTSDTGTPATIPLADTTNAGLFAPSEKTKVSYISVTQNINLDTLNNAVSNLITLSGVASNATSLGTFTGTTIPDNASVKQALQSLETSTEASQGGIQFKDEGADIGTRGQVKNVNFVGARVTTSVSGDTMTVTVSEQTNLNYTPSPINGQVTSSTGTPATIPLADSTNAGLFAPSEKTKLGFISVASNIDLDAEKTKVSSLTTLSGVASNATSLGAFTGATIPDNVSIKQALQSLETSLEAATLTTVKRLVKTVSATSSQTQNIIQVALSAASQSVSADITIFYRSNDNTVSSIQRVLFTATSSSSSVIAHQLAVTDQLIVGTATVPIVTSTYSSGTTVNISHANVALAAIMDIEVKWAGTSSVVIS